MAGVQDSALAAAVSNAGGLGSLPAALLPPDILKLELEALRDLTDRPFNVNFFCHSKPQRDAQRERRWHLLLKPYFDEFGLDSGAIAEGPARAAFDARVAGIVEPFRPPVVSFHFGLPTDELLKQVRSWGSKILATATTVAEGAWLSARGVDGIIAQGWEAGGHRGMFLSHDVATQVGTLALVPQLARMTTIPIVAAGGISDSRAVRASLELGAVCVQVGTAYLLCPEATTSPIHRSLIQDTTAPETAVTNIFTGRPARGIVNRAMRELGYLNSGAPPFPLAAAAMGALRSASEAGGKADFSPMWCGQNTTGCKPIPAAALTQQLMADP